MGMIKYTHKKQCEVIIDPCPNPNGSFVKPALKVGREWVITPHPQTHTQPHPHPHPHPTTTNPNHPHHTHTPPTTPTPTPEKHECGHLPMLSFQCMWF